MSVAPAGTVAAFPGAEGFGCTAPGDVSAEEVDSISIGSDPPGVGGVDHVVIDRCSLSRSVDEVVGIWYEPSDLTISWCIISEGLASPVHHKGPHSCGMLVGDYTRSPDVNIVGKVYIPGPSLVDPTCILPFRADANAGRLWPRAPHRPIPDWTACPTSGNALTPSIPPTRPTRRRIATATATPTWKST